MDFCPSSSSMAWIWVSNRSAKRALQVRSTLRTSSLTVVENTSGRGPVLATKLMYSTVLCAFSTVLMKGKVIFLNSTPSNCVSTVLPSVSAVMPVPSERKNTERMS